MLASSFAALLALVANDLPPPVGSAINNTINQIFPAVERLEPPAGANPFGVQRAKSRQGPFTVPAMVPTSESDDNGMGHFEQVATLPCHDCYITGFAFGLEYPNGSDANVDTGMYLHHGVLVNMNRADATCLNTTAAHFQRMFGAGNERTHADLTVNGTRKAGYYIGPTDTIGLVMEVMNMQTVARDVLLTATWDYVVAGKNTTAGFASAVPVWLDIDGACGSFSNGSEVAVAPNTPVFTYDSPAPWSPGAGVQKGLVGESPAVANRSAPTSYDVIVAGSHMHDGGLQLDIAKNGQIVCEGTAHYGETAAYLSPPSANATGMGSMPGMNMASGSNGNAGERLSHISSIHLCSNVGTTTPADKWTVAAHYNMTAHPGLETTKGAVKPIMGIGILFLVESSAGKV